MGYKVDKPWGHEFIFAKTKKYVGKILHVKEGEELSLQFHRKKDETIYIARGRLKVFFGDAIENLKTIAMKPGDSFHIPPNMVHKMIALRDTDIFEVSTPQIRDVVRLADKYGRAGQRTK
jgi:mannose-6-phosphate isomerase